MLNTLLKFHCNWLKEVSPRHVCCCVLQAVPCRAESWACPSCWAEPSAHLEQEAVCLICWLHNQHKQLEINWNEHTLVPLPSGKKHEAVRGKPRNWEGTRDRGKAILTVMHGAQITQLWRHQASQFRSPKTMNFCPACTFCKYLNTTCLACPASNTHAYEKQELYLISGKAKENTIPIPLHKCSVPSELLQQMAEGKGALAMENTGIWMVGLSLLYLGKFSSQDFFLIVVFKSCPVIV